jgi:ribosomal protein L24
MVTQHSKDKGKTGTVLRVFRKRNMLVVEGVNLVGKNILINDQG